MENIKKGDIINFGRYESDDIAWCALAVEEGKALLLSEKGIDIKKYNDTFSPVTWETCTLRGWLNDEFLKVAFNSDECDAIETTIVTADKNPEHETNPGKDAKDKIFLLSISEVERYLDSKENRKITGSSIFGVLASNLFGITDEEAWWLRSPGDGSECAAYVDACGLVCCNGSNVDDDELYVRPALWISIEKFKKKDMANSNRYNDDFCGRTTLRSLPNVAVKPLASAMGIQGDYKSIQII